MKAIVVYFSLEGNTEYVAEKIAGYTNADTLRIEPRKDYPTGKISKYFWGGKSVVFGEQPQLASYHFNADKYDVIILGTPVWAGSFAPPLKTFLKENNLSNKKVAFYACNSGGDAPKCFQNLQQELPGANVIGTLCLANPKVKHSEENIQKIKEFCDKL